LILDIYIYYIISPFIFIIFLTLHINIAFHTYWCHYITLHIYTLLSYYTLLHILYTYITHYTHYYLLFLSLIDIANIIRLSYYFIVLLGHYDFEAYDISLHTLSFISLILADLFIIFHYYFAYFLALFRHYFLSLLSYFRHIFTYYSILAVFLLLATLSLILLLHYYIIFLPFSY